jgi:3-isopropylmalate/(R)-2-methylmalate dehydratase large subunit
MTITEKILAKAAKREKVSPGEIVVCKIDLICIDEVQFEIFESTLEKMGTPAINKEGVVFVIDHYFPPTSLDQARAIQMTREFASSHGLNALEGGIKDQLLWEHGLIRPEMILVATDSHINICGAFGAFAAAVGPSEAAMMAVTGQSWFKVPETIRCEMVGELQPLVTAKDIGLHILGERGVTFAAYKAIEFSGPLVESLSMDGRVTLCNMSTEMGAKNAIIEPDSVTEAFLKIRKVTGYPKIASDSDASYAETFVVDASKIEPLVALPHSPGNVKPLSQVQGTKIDQGFIGSCGNGNMEDLRIAARILKGRTINPNVRLIVTPASRELHIQASKEGLVEIFLKAGATVSGTTCSVCAGFEGCLLPKEVCITSSPRNFKGRMGSPEALIYLGSPATVAASAIKGKITDPREFV